MLRLAQNAIFELRRSYLSPLFRTASSPGFRGGGEGIKEGKFIKEGFLYKDL
jgi:hypothetical protein